jgi:hypothetical protein
MIESIPWRDHHDVGELLDGKRSGAGTVHRPQVRGVNRVPQASPRP